MKTQVEMDKLRKLWAISEKNIRTNWIRFIRQRTGLIRQRTGLIRRQNQRTKLIILRSYVDLLNYPFKFSTNAVI